MAGILWRIVLWFLFCALLLNLVRTQQVDDGTSSKQNCFVRDGRDGIPGRPGAPGRPGQPGRDGRDCTIKWSLNRVFEMEKRLRDIDSKCQLVVNEAEEMKQELKATEQQTQRLLRILAGKKILDSDTFIQRSSYEIIPTLGEAQTQADILLPGEEPPFTTPVFSTSAQPTVKQSCQKRLAFHVQDKVETRGAVNMEVFNMEGNTFLAVANFHLRAPKNGYNIESFIYQMNSTTEEFELFQTLPTIGCRSITYFSDGSDSYIVAAHHFDGSTYALDSVIYKWNGTQFVNYTQVKTFGASSAQFFSFNGENFLAFANYRNDTSVSIFSIVYRWNQGKLEVFQKLLTHGAVDCKFHRSEEGEVFLVFANYYTPSETFNVQSTIYKWDGNRFVFAQNVEATAAMGVDIFESDEGMFVALASHRTDNSWHSHTNVYRWNGTEFVLFQELETNAAIKVHHFVVGGTLYLIVANYFDEITGFRTHSMVYQFKKDRFVKFQGIPTTGAYDLQPFIYRGAPYLAAAFRFDGKHGTLESKIYKMYKGCVAREDALP